MKEMVCVLAAALSVSACSSPGTVTQKGGLRMSVSWPQSAGFRVQVIPAQTRSLLVSVTGQGLSRPKEQTLTRSGSAQQTLEMELPAGPKQVTVRALSETREILAEDQDSIDVLPGRTSRLELDLQLMTPPQPSQSPASQSENNSGSTDNNENPGQTGGTTGQQPTDSSLEPTESSSPASPQPSPQPSLLPSGVLTSGGGGGSSGGNTSSGNTAPELTDLTANPQTLTGLSYPSEITAVIHDPDNFLQAQHFSWSCVDTASQVSCNNFMPTSFKNRMAWQAPSFASGPYLIKVEINDGVHPVMSRTVSVSVQSGTGTLNGGNGAIDGGQTGTAG